MKNLALLLSELIYFSLFLIEFMHNMQNIQELKNTPEQNHENGIINV